MQTLQVVVTATALALTAAATWAAEPPLPPLLMRAHSGTGWYGACPVSSEAEARDRQQQGRQGISPELTEHLASAFPAGTAEATMIASLTQQGFELPEPCKSDTTIKRAVFNRKGSGLIPYTTFAQVYWQTDASGRVLWTKGFIAFTGL